MKNSYAFDYRLWKERRLYKFQITNQPKIDNKQLIENGRMNVGAYAFPDIHSVGNTCSLRLRGHMTSADNKIIERGSFDEKIANETLLLTQKLIQKRWV